MEIKCIELNIDKSKDIYSSDNCQLLLKSYDEYYQKIGFNLPWVGYFLIRDNKIVGSCGFTGQPEDGNVEIAYWTFKEFEEQGIASFACRELVLIARKENSKITVTAKTAPEKNASTKILQKNNFVYSKVVQDEEIGDAWLWILKG
ncbi:MAG: GNAT family N-acetyltransferase [Aquaticitalea sp.]